MSSPGEVPSAASSAASADAGPAGQGLLGGRGPQRHRAHVGQRDPAVDRGHADDGPVVGPPDELLVSPGLARAARHPHRGEQLVGLQRGLEVAGEEVVRGRPCRVPPGPAAPPSRRARPAPWAGRRRGRRGPASRRWCPGGGSAGRRPAPAAWASSGACGADQRGGGQVGVPGGRADDQLVAVAGDARSARSSRPMSMSTSGAASRSFIIGSSECPPASTLASSPCSASRSRACAGDSAAIVLERRGDHRATSESAASATCSSAAAAGRLGAGARLGRGQHGADDVVVAGAPAQVALQALADLRPRSGAGSRPAGPWPPSPCPGCRTRTAGRAPAGTPPAPGAAPRRLPGPSPRPSAVVTDWPAACTASTVHDFTDSPSSSTVQAPQEVVSQPTLAARSPSARAGSARAAAAARRRRPRLAVDRELDLHYAFSDPDD